MTCPRKTLPVEAEVFSKLTRPGKLSQNPLEISACVVRKKDCPAPNSCGDTQLWPVERKGILWFLMRTAFQSIGPALYSMEGIAEHYIDASISLASVRLDLPLPLAV